MSKKIFFNKYKVQKLIGITSFSSVYEGININGKEPVCMKFESKKKYVLLESEAYCLYNLKGFGIPKFITFGKNGLYNILIMELLGMSIYNIWDLKKIKKEYRLKNTCMLALQVLNRLEYIHSKNYIHRDIKPSNLVIGRKDPNIIYLIDFGFCCKYRSSNTGKHIKFKRFSNILGSLKYLSINGNKGYQQSRRDDLESLGYLIIKLLIKELPRERVDNLKINLNKISEKICKEKSSISPEILCKGLPEEILEYIKYCRNLKFEEDPNYEYLRSLFTKILIKNQLKNDLNFSWIIKRKSKEKNVEEENRVNCLNKRRSSSKNRFIIKLKNL